MDVFIPNSVLNYKNTDMNIKLHASAFRDDGDIRMDGLPLLRREPGRGGRGVCCVGTVVPAHLQDCTWADGMECCGCDGGRFLDCTVYHGETVEQERKESITSSCCQ